MCICLETLTSEMLRPMWFRYSADWQQGYAGPLLLGVANVLVWVVIVLHGSALTINIVWSIYGLGCLIGSVSVPLNTL